MKNDILSTTLISDEKLKKFGYKENLILDGVDKDIKFKSNIKIKRGSPNGVRKMKIKFVTTEFFENNHMLTSNDESLLKLIPLKDYEKWRNLLPWRSYETADEELESIFIKEQTDILNNLSKEEIFLDVVYAQWLLEEKERSRQYFINHNDLLQQEIERITNDHNKFLKDLISRPPTDDTKEFREAIQRRDNIIKDLQAQLFEKYKGEI